MRDHARVRQLTITFGLASLAVWPLVGADAASGLPPKGERASAVCLELLGKGPLQYDFSSRLARDPGKLADSIDLPQPLFLWLPRINVDIAELYGLDFLGGWAPGTKVVNVPKNKFATTLEYGDPRQQFPAQVDLWNCNVKGSFPAPAGGRDAQWTFVIYPRTNKGNLTINVMGSGTQKRNTLAYGLFPSATRLARSPDEPPGLGEPPPPPMPPGGPPPPPGTGWGLDASCRWDGRLNFGTTLISDTGGLPDASGFPKTLELELRENPPNLRWHCPVEQGMDLDQPVIFTDRCAFLADTKTFEIGGSRFSSRWSFRYEGFWKGDLSVKNETASPFRVTNFSLNQLPGGPSAPPPVVPVAPNICEAQGLHNFRVKVSLDPFKSAPFIKWPLRFQLDCRYEKDQKDFDCSLDAGLERSFQLNFQQDWFTETKRRAFEARWNATAAGRPNRPHTLKLICDEKGMNGSLTIAPRPDVPADIVEYEVREELGR